MWPRGWVEAQFYPSMTAALEGCEWSAARPGRTLPLGKTRYPLYRRLGGPQGRSGRAENLAQPGFDPWTVQPVVSCYIDRATRPIPTHRWKGNIKIVLKEIVLYPRYGLYQLQTTDGYCHSRSWVQTSI